MQKDSYFVFACCFNLDLRTFKSKLCAEPDEEFFLDKGFEINALSLLDLTF